VWGIHKEAQQGNVVLPCRFTPILRGVREEVQEGAYTLVLEFETKKEMTMDMWTDRVDKIESFFGPGIKAKVCFSSHLLRGLVDFCCLDCSPAAAHPAARHAVLAWPRKDMAVCDHLPEGPSDTAGWQNAILRCCRTVPLLRCRHA
jgi:hypothetical protein